MTFSNEMYIPSCYPSTKRLPLAIYYLLYMWHHRDFVLSQSGPNLSHITSWQPILTITSTSYWSHTHRPQCLLTIPHNFMSFFTLANSISSRQSIQSSRSNSDVPSSVEPSPTLSGPHSYFLLWAPTGPCPHFIREQHLFLRVIPPVNLEQGICHVQWRIASVLSWRVLHRYAIHSTIQWINE